MRTPLRADGPAELLRRRLSSLASLADADMRLLAGLQIQRRAHAITEELVGVGEVGRSPRLIVSGWAARLRTLQDGRRQIFRLLLPGDVIGVADRANPLAWSSVVALTRVETTDAALLAQALKENRPEHAGTVGALLIAAAIEDAGLLDQIVRLGRQTALERTAHLLLELRWRLGQAGLVNGDRFALPLTQEVLADIVGLSVVHVNRTLQSLRRDRLINIRSGAVELLDVDRLVAIADFHPPRTLAGSIEPQRVLARTA